MNAPHPTIARKLLPKGACDCHAHVFGPYERFPLAPSRTYTPPETSVEAYLRLLDSLGLTRGVLVQPSAYGLDNSALVDALKSAPDRLRGVAVANGDTSHETLIKLRECGVRGLRFSRLLDASGTPRYRNAVDVSEIKRLLPGMREAGLHAQLWLGLDELPDLAPLIRSAGIPFVIDHLARCDPARGVENTSFALLCELIREGHLWVKLTPYRSSLKYPNYEDMRIFHEHLMRVQPDHLLWGSDWPHVNMDQEKPDAAHLLHLLMQWTGDVAFIHKILVSNPGHLYGF